jgi:hypothetical protein
MAAADVETEIRQIQALRAQTRIWRWGVSLALLVIVVVCLTTLRNAVTNLTNDGAVKDAFVKDLGARLQQNALPAVEQMGMDALHQINYAAEVKKLNQRTPELAQASMQQLKLFRDEMSQRGQKVLNATFGAALKQHEAKIRSMFPQATDAQIADVMTNLTNEAQIQVADVNEALFAPHKKAVDSIISDFDTIQNMGAKDYRGQEPTWEMALLIFDLARTNLKTLMPEDNTNAKSGANMNAKSGAKAKEVKI